MTPARTAEEAYAVCEAIAQARARATARSAYGDGYRAAAEHILTEIHASRTGREPSRLDRELHDAEIEARTLARVLDIAVAVVEDTGAQTDAADAVRALVGSFFADEDLPPMLRAGERSSGARLPDGRPLQGGPSWALASGDHARRRLRSLR